MILTTEQVLALVKAPQDPVIDTNRQLQDDHKIHIQGVGFETVLRQIIGYENVEDFDRKKLLTKPFTRPLFKKIKNAQGRWKNAWGTTKFYNFKKGSDVNNNDKLAKEFKTQVLSQVWKNGTMDAFVKKFLADAIYEEFNGILLVEKGQKQTLEDGKQYEVREGIARAVKPGEILKPYIVFVSVNDIHTFKYTGDKIEFLVLKFGKIKRTRTNPEGKEVEVDVEIFRVIDDVKDYVVEKENNVTKLADGYPVLEHKAGRCPASNVTYLNQTLTNDRTKTSPIDDIIKLLDYHLHQFAEHLVTEVLHAHPNFWQVGQKCMNVIQGIKCEGGRICGQAPGIKLDIDCPACQGTNHNLKKNASTVTIIPALADDGSPFALNGHVMGYVAPPIDALEYQEKAIDWMEEKILSSALGLNNVSHSEKLEKTATEAMINLKPLEDIISSIIDIIEGVEKTLTDIIGRMYYGEKYVGAEIIYGRKLSLRNENTLLPEMKESKEAGVSMSHIKSLNEELTYARFVRSEYDMQRNIILNELEPLIGYTFDEVETSKNVDQATKILKQNFNDLIARFETEAKMNIVDFEPAKELPEKVAAIREKLLTYVAEIEVQEAAPERGAVAEDTIGKIPLALQQISLAITRAKEAGNEPLASRLTAKMDELMNQFLE